MTDLRPDPTQLDGYRARRAFGRAAPGYDAGAVVQAEVRERLLERLDLVRIRPAVVLDLGCGTGRAAPALAKRYSGSRVLAMDYAWPMLRQARRNAPRFGRVRSIGGHARRLPLADNSVDLIFSNLVLHWCAPLEPIFVEIQRVLRPGGLLTFTSFGPDTLKELRAAWATVDDAVHVHQFEDMHNIGDALMAARLAEPVMDMEILKLTYPDTAALMRDIKNIGVTNAAAGRSRALTGKGKLSALAAAYEPFRETGGLLPSTFEVVYGHAWGPQGPVSFSDRETGEARVPLSQLRRR